MHVTYRLVITVDSTECTRMTLAVTLTVMEVQDVSDCRVHPNDVCASLTASRLLSALRYLPDSLPRLYHQIDQTGMPNRKRHLSISLHRHLATAGPDLDSAHLMEIHGPPSASQTWLAFY